MFERGPLISIEHSGFSLTGQKLPVCYWSPDYVKPPCTRASSLGDLLLFPRDDSGLFSGVTSYADIQNSFLLSKQEAENDAQTTRSGGCAAFSGSLFDLKKVDLVISRASNTGNNCGRPHKQPTKNPIQSIKRSDFLPR